MAQFLCSECGQSVTAVSGPCPHCGHALENGKLPPDILNWARGQLNEEVTVAGLREIRETGGLELKDFIQELEQAALPHE